MARRRLETALEVGKSIAKGNKFTQMKVLHDIKLEKELDGVYSLQFSFDGKFLAVGCRNGTIRLYDSMTGRKLTDLRKTRYGGFPIMCLRFNPNQQHLLYAATAEGKVLSCDTSDFINDGAGEQKHQEKQGLFEASNDERCVEIVQVTFRVSSSLDPEETPIIGISSGSKLFAYGIVISPLAPKELISLLSEKKGVEKNEINCMDFDYQYQRYATAGKDLSVRIYDAHTNQMITEYTGYDNTKDPTDFQSIGNAMRVFALKYHPEYDDIIVTGGWDRQVKIWDSRSKDGVKRFIPGPNICGDSLDLKGYKILTGSYEGTHALQVWNYSDGGLDKTIPFPCGPDGAFLYCAQFCDNDVVVAGGGKADPSHSVGSNTNQAAGIGVNHPRSAKAINMVTDEVIGEIVFEKTVQALDTTHGGRLIAVADAGVSLKICSLS